MFAGCDNGLVMIDALNHNVLCHWEEDKVEITNIQVSIITEQVYLLSTLDDMGKTLMINPGCQYD